MTRSSDICSLISVLYRFHSSSKIKQNKEAATQGCVCWVTYPWLLFRNNFVNWKNYTLLPYELIGRNVFKDEEYFFLFCSMERVFFKNKSFNLFYFWQLTLNYSQIIFLKFRIGYKICWLYGKNNIFGIFIFFFTC